MFCCKCVCFQMKEYDCVFERVVRSISSCPDGLINLLLSILRCRQSESSRLVDKGLASKAVMFNRITNIINNFLKII